MATSVDVVRIIEDHVCRQPPTQGPCHFSSYQPDFWLLGFASLCQKRVGAGLNQHLVDFVCEYLGSLTSSGRITLKFVFVTVSQSFFVD